MHELEDMRHLTCAFLMDLSKMEGDAVNLVFGEMYEVEREEDWYRTAGNDQ